MTLVTVVDHSKSVPIIPGDLAKSFRDDLEWPCSSFYLCARPPWIQYHGNCHLYFKTIRRYACPILSSVDHYIGNTSMYINLPPNLYFLFRVRPICHTQLALSKGWPLNLAAVYADDTGQWSSFFAVTDADRQSDAVIVSICHMLLASSFRVVA